MIVNWLRISLLHYDEEIGWEEEAIIQEPRNSLNLRIRLKLTWAFYPIPMTIILTMGLGIAHLTVCMCMITITNPIWFSCYLGLSTASPLIFCITRIAIIVISCLDLFPCNFFFRGTVIRATIIKLLCSFPLFLLASPLRLFVIYKAMRVSLLVSNG